jgi:hypothetical protein
MQNIKKTMQNNIYALLVHVESFSELVKNHPLLTPCEQDEILEPLVSVYRKLKKLSRGLDTDPEIRTVTCQIVPFPVVIPQNGNFEYGNHAERKTGGRP